MKAGPPHIGPEPRTTHCRADAALPGARASSQHSSHRAVDPHLASQGSKIQVVSRPPRPTVGGKHRIPVTAMLIELQPGFLNCHSPFPHSASGYFLIALKCQFRIPDCDPKPVLVGWCPPSTSPLWWQASPIDDYTPWPAGSTSSGPLSLCP